MRVNGRNPRKLGQNNGIDNMNDVNEVLVNEIHFGWVSAIWLP